MHETLLNSTVLFEYMTNNQWIGSNHLPPPPQLEWRNGDRSWVNYWATLFNLNNLNQTIKWRGLNLQLGRARCPSYPTPAQNRAKHTAPSWALILGLNQAGPAKGLPPWNSHLQTARFRERNAPGFPPKAVLISKPLAEQPRGSSWRTPGPNQKWGCSLVLTSC